VLPDPCLDREYCCDLARTYCQESLRFRQLGERYQEIWYEEALADPMAVARELDAFTGSGADGVKLAAAANLVHPELASHGRVRSEVPTVRSPVSQKSAPAPGQPAKIAEATLPYTSVSRKSRPA